MYIGSRAGIINLLGAFCFGCSLTDLCSDVTGFTHTGQRASDEKALNRILRDPELRGRSKSLGYQSWGFFGPDLVSGPIDMPTFGLRSYKPSPIP